jgi:hypothetical protein
MKSQPISEMSTESLKKNYKVMRFVTGILLSIVIIITGSAAYVTVTKGVGVVSILPIIFVPMFVNNIVNLKKAKAELIARGEMMK